MVRCSMTEPEFTDLEFSDAGRYQNIFRGDEMIASFDHETGEFCVYDPGSDSEDPDFRMQL